MNFEQFQFHSGIKWGDIKSSISLSTKRLCIQMPSSTPLFSSMKSSSSVILFKPQCGCCEKSRRVGIIFYVVCRLKCHHHHHHCHHHHPCGPDNLIVIIIVVICHHCHHYHQRSHCHHYLHICHHHHRHPYPVTKVKLTIVGFDTL